MLRLIQSLRADQRGMGMIEFALLVPLMLSLLLGGFEITQLVSANLRVGDSAETVANLVSQQTTVTSSMISNFCTGAQLVMTPFSAKSLSVAIAEVSNKSGTISVAWQDTSCGGAPSIGNAVTLASTMVPNNGDSVVVVVSSYGYTPVTHYLMGSAYSLSETAFSRPRNVAQIAYN